MRLLWKRFSIEPNSDSSEIVEGLLLLAETTQQLNKVAGGSKAKVKKFLRTNDWSSGHRIRSELWKELCKNSERTGNLRLYRETVTRMERDQAIYVFRPSFLNYPNNVLAEHHLKDEGKHALLRVLSVIEQLRPDITHIPILYPLTAVMLHYMSEDDAFACLMYLLNQRQNSQKFLMQTDIATTASKRTLLMLVKKHKSHVYQLLKKLIPGQNDDSIVQVFNSWKAWIFKELPFAHLVRVVDCFLFEGQKVLFRVALSLLSQWAKARRSSLVADGSVRGDAVAIADDIATFCRDYDQSSRLLLKKAFAVFNLRMDTIQQLQNRYEIEQRSAAALTGNADNNGQPGPSTAASNVQSDVILSSIKLDSRIVTSRDQKNLLLGWIPARITQNVPKRLFSTSDDGTSFTRLWQKVDDADETLILIRSCKNEVFGAYCSASWRDRLDKRTTRASYFGTGESFLFRLSPSVPACYKWVGETRSQLNHNEQLYLSADTTMLVVGGGGNDGLGIHDDLTKGVTGACDTFENEPLAEGGYFDIADMEVFEFSRDEEE